MAAHACAVAGLAGDKIVVRMVPQEMMCGEEAAGAVLRLLCLLSLTQGGVPKKYYEPLRREVLHSYGHAWLPALSALQDAGALPGLPQRAGAAPLLVLRHLCVAHSTCAAVWSWVWRIRPGESRLKAACSVLVCSLSQCR